MNIFEIKVPLDEFLNCDVDEVENIRQINGTLSLVTIYEQYLNKNFTSVNLGSNEHFSYGKIEIRASLPITTILIPVIRIKAVNPCNTKYNPTEDCNKASYWMIIWLINLFNYEISDMKTQ